MTNETKKKEDDESRGTTITVTNTLNRYYSCVLVQKKQRGPLSL